MRDDVISFDGLDLTENNEKMLSFLVRNENDFDLFLSKFWRGGNTQFFSISEFRLYKIRNLKMDFEQFKSLYKKDEKHALEQLFQHPIEVFIVNAIVKNINDKIISLNFIFDKFSCNNSINASRFAHTYR